MKIKINDTTFKVKVCLSPEETKMGMMKRRFDDTFNGMLFFMPKGEQSFWMKNCIIPLDIIFIDNNKITSIHKNCPPCNMEDCENYVGYGNLVLEILGGTCDNLNIKNGDGVQLLF
jgi:uncharacterized membrane protein (UPF0127 family)